MTDAHVPKTVAIVGAGPSGLAAIRHAIQYGFQPVCFESNDKLGGVWNYVPEESSETSVMYSTVMNSSKEMSAFSDFPPDSDKPNFMHHSQLLQYFRDYAEQFDLERHIRLKHSVVNIVRSETFAKTGKWVVEFLDSEKTRKTEEFDGVLLAIGHHQHPNTSATWPGQDNFKGKIIHAQAYKHFKGYEDKSVVVVGVGNSGVDIASELSRVSQNIILSTRRGTWIAGRTYDYGVPSDIAMNSRFLRYGLLPYIPDIIKSRYYERKLNLRLDHQAYGLKPSHNVFGAHLTTNDDLPARLISGSVIIKPNIRRFTENGMVFEDGTIVSNVDSVILCTGYDIRFQLIENGSLIKVSNNHVDLYKYMFPLDLEKNTLAVLGCIQPSGCVWPIAEMQARVFFAQLAGEAELPSNDGMKSDALLKRIEMMETFYGSKRHTIQVNYVEFMDELATFLGCRPSLTDYIFSDPMLAYETTFGPCSPYVYRLKGPHKWEGAREAVMNLHDRVYRGYHPGNPYHTSVVDSSSTDISMLVIVVIVCIICYLFI